MLVELGAETVDHLVQRDKIRPLDVPMRLLGQQSQVDRVGEPGVEGADRHRLRVRGQVVVGVILLHVDPSIAKAEAGRCRPIG